MGYPRVDVERKKRKVKHIIDKSYRIVDIDYDVYYKTIVTPYHIYWSFKHFREEHHNDLKPRLKEIMEAGYRFKVYRMYHKYLHTKLLVMVIGKKVNFELYSNKPIKLNKSN